MKCSCCGKRKRFLESFEELDTKVQICVECSKKLYKYQDFRNEKKDDEALKVLTEIRGEKNTEEFICWFEEFIQRLNSKHVTVATTSINTGNSSEGKIDKEE